MTEPFPLPPALRVFDWSYWLGCLLLFFGVWIGGKASGYVLQMLGISEPHEDKTGDA